jgi:hypothetical protein
MTNCFGAARSRLGRCSLPGRWRPVNTGSWLVVRWQCLQLGNLTMQNAAGRYPSGWPSGQAKLLVALLRAQRSSGDLTLKFRAAKSSSWGPVACACRDGEVSFKDWAGELATGRRSYAAGSQGRHGVVYPARSQTWPAELATGRRSRSLGSPGQDVVKHIQLEFSKPWINLTKKFRGKIPPRCWQVPRSFLPQICSRILIQSSS